MHRVVVDVLYASTVLARFTVSMHSSKIIAERMQTKFYASANQARQLDTLPVATQDAIAILQAKYRDITLECKVM